MKKEYTQKGFTLIELLVVIAIIGLLATIVLAALGTTKKQSVDTAIKQTLSGVRNQAELYYYNNANRYTGVCTLGAVSSVGATRSIYSQLLDAAKKANIATVSVNPTTAGAYNKVTCNASPTAWAAEVPLSTSKSGAAIMLCVDSTGKLKQENINVVLAVNQVACQ